MDPSEIERELNEHDPAEIQSAVQRAIERTGLKPYRMRCRTRGTRLTYLAARGEAVAAQACPGADLDGPGCGATMEIES